MKRNLAFLSLLLVASLSAQAQQEFIPTVEIPAGTFWMGGTGAGENYDEAPMHRVTISRPFRMGVTEVTNAQYEQFRPEHRELRGKRGFSTGDDEAVVFVSYDDAVAFCRWLSEKEGKTYRLPTEAEWEYACRAGTTTPFSTGGNITVDQANWYSSYPYIEGEGGGAYRRQTVPVDEFEPNPWGIYNMHGNVSEWCWDYYGEYGAQAQDNPTGAQSGRNRVMRGGGWYDYAKHVRSAYRSAMPADYTDYKIGFRVARNAE